MSAVAHTTRLALDSLVSENAESPSMMGVVFNSTCTNVHLCICNACRSFFTVVAPPPDLLDGSIDQFYELQREIWITL